MTLHHLLRDMIAVRIEKRVIFVFLYLISLHGAQNQKLPALIKLEKDSNVPGTSSPQLKCVGGDAYGTEYEPSLVYCFLKEDDLWECEGYLDSFVTFGAFEVSCLGDEYQAPNNHSCKMEYYLEFADGPIDEGSFTGSFLTIMLCVVIMIFIFRQRRPPVQQNGPSPPGGSRLQQHHGTITTPRVLQILAYSIIAIIVFATLLFMTLIAFMLTTVTLTG